MNKFPKDISWYNPYQTFAAGICYGALFFTPLMHNVFAFWTRFLPSNSMHAVVFKTGIDCVTSFPVNVSALIAFQTLARKESSSTNLQKFQSIQNSLQLNLWPTLIMGWKIWPAVTVLNYKFVPVIYRVLLLNSVSYCWNVALIFYTIPSKSSQRVQ
uniref:Protein Mpv17 n=1 Tax=Aplanochytrium stocchinoi TaxID=215587 RepID=A0A6S8BPT0_9STRA